MKAYLLIAAKLRVEKKNYTGESFNVGPGSKNSYTVLQLIKKIKYFDNVKINFKKNKKIKESKLLSLNVNKIKQVFNIKPILNIDQTSDYISEWYNVYFKNKNKILLTTIKQIKTYSKLSNLKI